MNIKIVKAVVHGGRILAVGALHVLEGKVAEDLVKRGLAVQAPEAAPATAPAAAPAAGGQTSPTGQTSPSGGDAPAAPADDSAPKNGKKK